MAILAKERGERNTRMWSDELVPGPYWAYET